MWVSRPYVLYLYVMKLWGSDHCKCINTFHRRLQRESGVRSRAALIALNFPNNKLNTRHVRDVWPCLERRVEFRTILSFQWRQLVQKPMQQCLQRECTIRASMGVVLFIINIVKYCLHVWLKPLQTPGSQLKVAVYCTIFYG